MNKFEIRTQKKKDAVVAASLRLFKEKGYTNSSISEIAALAGVSAVSIYNYFGSKESLVGACVAALFHETNDMVAALLATPEGFEEKLLKAVALCTEKPHELMAEYFSQEALDDRVFVELFQQGVSDIRMDILEAFIESGKAEGSIDAALSTDVIMDFLRAAAAVQERWQTPEEIQAKSGALYRLTLYGLIGR